MSLRRPPSALRDIHGLDAGELGVHASAGPLFRAAIFGRDSIEVGEDLLPYYPALTRRVILALTSLQGRKQDDVSEEEPGRIHHEYRTEELAAGDPGSALILEDLAKRWGGTATTLCYYGSTDATPLFVTLITAYVARYGDALLQEQVTHRLTGEQRTVGAALVDACEWVFRRVTGSDLGLLEYRRQNPLGLLHQVWKDSVAAFVFADGRLVNPEAPIAPVELQGYAYDALEAGAQLLGRDDPARAKRFRALAAELPKRVLELYWMDGDDYFAAAAVDRDWVGGRPRQVDAWQTNAGLLLKTGLAQAFQEPWVVPALAKTLVSAEFLTPAGVRCRALRHAQATPFADYHGSYLAWVKETYDIAQGLRRQGLPLTAGALEQRILWATRLAGEHYEFFFVDHLGQVVYDPARATRLPSDGSFVTPNFPEPRQAWSVSAALAIKRAHDQEGVGSALDAELAAGIPPLEQPADLAPFAVELRADAEELYRFAQSPMERLAGKDEARREREE